jgi:hypothetical protein
MRYEDGENPKEEAFPLREFDGDKSRWSDTIADQARLIEDWGDKSTLWNWLLKQHFKQFETENHEFEI